MTKYRGFTHVIRLDNTKIDVFSYLNDDNIYLFSKLDGTNFCCFADDEGNIHVGSRTRECTLEKDNADSMLWFTTSSRTEKLRAFLVKHPDYIVYMEWLNGWAGRKQAGTIKQYLSTEGWIIAVYDTTIGKYLPFPQYYEMLKDIYDQIDMPIAVLNHPKLEDIESYLEGHFNLPETINQEGVVIYNYNYLDKFGNPQICKIVNEEFRANKGKSQKQNISNIDIESQIIEMFITDADITKTQNKIVIKLEMEKWENSNKTIGMLLNFVWNDLIEEEMGSIVKVFKFPTINFRLLRKLSDQRVRQFLGF